MQASNRIARVYSPEILQHMGRAFDGALESLPVNVGDITLLRRSLAVRIIRHVDRGEHDPAELCKRALAEVS